MSLLSRSGAQRSEPIAQPGSCRLRRSERPRAAVLVADRLVPASDVADVQPAIAEDRARLVWAPPVANLHQPSSSGPRGSWRRTSPRTSDSGAWARQINETGRCRTSVDEIRQDHLVCCPTTSARPLGRHVGRRRRDAGVSGDCHRTLPGDQDRGRAAAARRGRETEHAYTRGLPSTPIRFRQRSPLE